MRRTEHFHWAWWHHGRPQNKLIIAVTLQYSNVTIENPAFYSGFSWIFRLRICHSLVWLPNLDAHCSNHSSLHSQLDGSTVAMNNMLVYIYIYVCVMYKYLYIYIFVWYNIYNHIYMYMCVYHLNKCKTSYYCRGPLGNIAVSGQQKRCNVPVKTYLHYIFYMCSPAPGCI